MQSVNGAQFLNGTSLTSLSGSACGSYCYTVTVIVPIKSNMHHYNHINVTLTLRF